ncbi:MAG: DUF1848 domain-containing protein [Armatimonadetes bacterium]|nr:DUF1848 domain-containing protein [Armatimonadota bacterium]
MKVISASRRTDIPAFYSEWFINRIRDGYVRWVNPFSGAVHRASLRPEDVMAFVLWSKNYMPLLPYLNEIDTNGYRMLFHFTITGLPKEFEPNVPDTADLVECARSLSDRYGADAVLWRYDPVLISNVTDRRYHPRRFEELCAALEGAVKRCYFSFVVFHRKVQRNTETLRGKTGVVCYDLSTADRIETANALSDIASGHGIEMFSCCGDYLVDGRIKKAHCTDAELLHRLYPDRMRHLANFPVRDGCGCCECTDIGAYDTCAHGCVYCYANASPQSALWNYERHNPRLDMLYGNLQANSIRSSSTSTDRGSDDKLTLDLQF